MKRSSQIVSSLFSALLITTLAGFVSAAQITITSVSGSWHTATYSGSGGFGTIANGAQTSSIDWGGTVSHSGYDLTVSVPQDVITLPPTPTPYFPLGSFTHRNQDLSVNPSFRSLTSVFLDVVIDMQIDGVATGPKTFTFKFNHDETPNEQNASSCKYQAPAVNAPPCDDKVTFTTSNSATITVDNVNYTLAMDFVNNNGTPVSVFLTQEGLSNVASLRARFVLSGKVNTPTFNPAAGNYTGTIQVIMGDTTPGAEIHYTTNGSNPTASSTLYTTPISVSANTTFKAMAILSGMTDSDVATAAYTIAQQQQQVAAPSFSPNGGTFSGSVNVTMQTATSGAEIRYTTNGNNPTASSTLYTGAVTLTSNTTLKAIAIMSGMTNSAITSANFTVDPLVAATPTISPNGGTFTASVNVTLQTATNPAEIRYTTNGSNPTASSTLYTGQITLTSNMTVKAIAIASGMTNSGIATANFTILPPNTAPHADSQSGLTTPMNTAKAITLTGTDPENNNLTFAVSQPQHGSVSVAAGPAGSYTYTPAHCYTGPDSFTFKVNDGSLDSNTATVSITVNAVAKIVSGITISPKNKIVSAGTKIDFQYVIVDQCGQSMSDSVNWTSSGNNGSFLPNSGASKATFTSPMDAQTLTVTVTTVQNSKSDTATVRIVAFNAGEDLSEVKAGPVPFKANGTDTGITFRHLPPDTTIRLFTMTGRLVQTIDATSGGDKVWDIRNANFDKVASGVYLYRIESGSQVKEGKLVVIQ